MSTLHEEPEDIVRLIARTFPPPPTEPLQRNDRAGRIPEQTALADRPSSLGQLDRLPSEILSLVIGMLDIQAVARMGQVSFHGHLLVRSHPQYRDLEKFIPDVLAVLVLLGIADVHSLSPAYRTLFPENAKKILGLSDAHLQQLPTLRVPPRGYWPPKFARKGCRLVSMRAARELAISAGLAVPGVDAEEDKPLPPSKPKPDGSYGMATIRFPSVSPAGVVEEGLWCYGCQFLCDQYTHTKDGGFRQMLEELAARYPTPESTKRPVAVLQLRARPRAPCSWSTRTSATARSGCSASPD
ncbi:hypothetical protein C8A01DRAFT_40159 [Parachaetomium inaequale]|uniref:F-box domain-containing protein n=1 Tax=Parachaetomium inaequale TaxID=2588326 RepID=A0AAN6SM16_9PEZI|nr:hypothetical protein C8A01DRAFT_40159 [Parachaetomium inaequale]